MKAFGVSLVVAAIGLLLASDSGAADRRLTFRRDGTWAVADGRITPAAPRECFSMRARSGERLVVRIIPRGKLVTAGHVIAPSGATDGGPGGRIFDNVLRETGTYRICVEAREDTRAGRFRLEVSRTRDPSSRR